MVLPTALVQLGLSYRKLPLVRTSQCFLHLHRGLHNSLLSVNSTRPVFLRLPQYGLSGVHNPVASHSRSLYLDVKLSSKSNPGEEKDQLSLQRASSGPRLSAAQKGGHPFLKIACLIVVMWIYVHATISVLSPVINSQTRWKRLHLLDSGSHWTGCDR